MRFSRFQKVLSGVAPGDLYIFVSTGQSLSQGISPGGVTLSLTQPYGNVTPAGYGNRLRALFEPADMLGSNAVETIHSGCANLLSELLRDNESTDPDDYIQCHFGVGLIGRAYIAIEKGGTFPSYQASLDMVAHLQTLAATSADVVAIMLVHGEQDDIDGNTTYDADILDLYTDYNADLPAITGQGGAIPLFLCQMSSWTKVGDATAITPYLQLAAAVDNANIHLVTPKYHLPYIDGRHLTPAGYRQLGEHYAVAMYEQIWGGGWDCLRPTAITRSAAVITATFNVPSGGTLVLDNTNVTDPGDYGFEYSDNGDGNSVSIDNVALNDTDKVDITLTGTPTGTGQRLRYAYTGTPDNDAGPETGARGCLRDDDTRFTSRHGYNLWNWCVHFDEAIT